MTYFTLSDEDTFHDIVAMSRCLTRGIFTHPAMWGVTDLWGTNIMAI